MYTVNGEVQSTAAQSIVNVLDLAAPLEWTRARRFDELDGWWSFLSMPQNVNLTAYGELRAHTLYGARPSFPRPFADPVREPFKPTAAAVTDTPSVVELTDSVGSSVTVIVNGHGKKCKGTLPPSPPPVGRKLWKHYKTSVKNGFRFFCLCCGRT